MESNLVTWLHSQRTDPSGTVIGLGDDALVVDPAGRGPIVLTTDQLVEGVHIETGFSEWEVVGKKAANHALSDLAAMSARPWFAMSTLALPPQFSEKSARRVLSGIRDACDVFRCPLAGGDLSQSPATLVITVTGVGLMEGRIPWSRSGGQPGDRLYVTGHLGGSRLSHHLHFRPRIDEALSIAKHVSVHAAMDISDGLGLDLSRLLEASQVGAIIDLSAIPISPDALSLSESSGEDPFTHAWGDGEDFELLLAVPEHSTEELEGIPSIRCHQIGTLVKGAPEIRDLGGNLVAPKGWIHG